MAKKNFLNSVKMTSPTKSMFDLSHDVKLSFNMGELIPIMCTECIPGDKFSISCESMLRFMPLVAPVMHRMDVTMHYFFVPNRLVWANWEDFITGQKIDDVDIVPPYLTMETTSYTRLCDYLGIPTPIGVNTERVSALPFAAYQKIYNEYYRDQNLIEPVNDSLNDGDNTGEFTGLRVRAWEHDYFTASLPDAQQGNPVDIPLGKVELDMSAAGNAGKIRPANTYTGEASAGELEVISAGELGRDTGVEFPYVYDPNGSLVTEPTTINDLRSAFRLQEWLEKTMRGGKRYIEHILAHFGVRSSDKRLQRPEYITGVKSPVMISEVLNTTGTTELPQGNMAGHGVSVTAGQYGSYYCEEHGYIIGIMSVMPKTAYQQGIPKHFLKTSFLDYAWPSFVHLGEQEVKNKEVYAFQGAAGEETFGYVPRYGEYRFENNRVAGNMRTSLDFWHLGRIFATPPALNQSFVECIPDDRIFAVTEGQALIAHVYNKVSALRPLPKYGTPASY